MKLTSIWVKPCTIEEFHQQARNTLSDCLGIELIEVGDAHLIATMPVDARTIQPMGMLHGGASCALAETIGSAAANYCIEPNQICVGLDLNINHIRPVSSGKVTAIAKPLHIGTTTQIWEIKIYNEEKKIISVARLTVLVINRKPGSEDPGKQPA